MRQLHNCSTVDKACTLTRKPLPRFWAPTFGCWQLNPSKTRQVQYWTRMLRQGGGSRQAGERQRRTAVRNFWAKKQKSFVFLDPRNNKLSQVTVYIYLSIYPSIYRFIYPSIYLSIHPSIHPSIYPSIHLSMYLKYCACHENWLPGHTKFCTYHAKSS